MIWNMELYERLFIVLYVYTIMFETLMTCSLILYTHIHICTYVTSFTFQLVAKDEFSNWRYSVLHNMLPQIILWKMKDINWWNVTQCMIYTYKLILNEHGMVSYNLYQHTNIHICDSKTRYIYANTHIYMYTHIYVYMFMQQPHRVYYTFIYVFLSCR